MAKHSDLERNLKQNESRFRKINTKLKLTNLPNGGIRIDATTLNDLVYESIYIHITPELVKKSAVANLSDTGDCILHEDGGKEMFDSLYNNCVKIQNAYGGKDKFEFYVIVLECMKKYTIAINSIFIKGIKSKRLLKIFTGNDTTVRENEIGPNGSVFLSSISPENGYFTFGLLGGLVSVKIEPSMVIKKNDEMSMLKRTTAFVFKALHDKLLKVDLSKYSDAAQAYGEVLKYLYFYSIIQDTRLQNGEEITCDFSRFIIEEDTSSDVFIINGVEVVMTDKTKKVKETFILNSYDDFDTFNEKGFDMARKIADKRNEELALELERKEKQYKLKIEADKKEQQRIMEKRRIEIQEAEKAKIPWVVSHKLSFSNYINSYTIDEIEFDLLSEDNDIITRDLKEPELYYRAKAIQEYIYMSDYRFSKLYEGDVLHIFTDKNNHPYHRTIFEYGMETMYKIDRNQDNRICIKYTWLLDGEIIKDGFINSVAEARVVLKEIREFYEELCFKNIKVIDIV